MAIKKLSNGRWELAFYPEGRYGKFVRKRFPTKREAENYQALTKTRVMEGVYKPVVKDARKLSQLANDWYKLIGHELSSGEKRRQCILRTAKAIGDPIANKADPEVFLEYRKNRMQSGITANHLNHELVYIKTAYKKLAEIGNYKGISPFENIKPLTIKQKQLHFLSEDEVLRLISSCKQSYRHELLKVVMLCLKTGARFGEAENLHAEHVRYGKVEYIDTKNGDNRSIPINEDFRKYLLEGAPQRGRLFRPCSLAFKKAISEAGIELPKGQRTHVLRHTYASHYIMKGGNVSDLNKILGHKTLEVTKRYTHLSDDHLKNAVNNHVLDDLDSLI